MRHYLPWLFVGLLAFGPGWLTAAPASPILSWPGSAGALEREVAFGTEDYPQLRDLVRSVRRKTRWGGLSGLTLSTWVKVPLRDKTFYPIARLSTLPGNGVHRHFAWTLEIAPLPSGGHGVVLRKVHDSLTNNAFIAPRLNNSFAADLSNEEVFTTEFGYAFNGPIFSAKLNAYYTRFNNVTELDQFYNDQESRYSYLSMTGVEKQYMGLELAASVKITSNLTLKALATYSDAEYINNPDALLTFENETDSDHDKVYIDGMKESGTPLSAYSLGLDYNVKGWFFSINGNYYHRGYIDFSTYLRMGKVLGISETASGVVGEDGQTVNPTISEQEEFDGGFMLDLSIGKYIRLKDGKSLSINLNINNLLNNTDMRTGGYEQNRDDSYDDGSARAYVFSRNSKYYYASRCNAFLNLGFRF